MIEHGVDDHQMYRFSSCREVFQQPAKAATEAALLAVVLDVLTELVQAHALVRLSLGLDYRPPATSNRPPVT
jgi:hypothetical protein